MTTANNPTFDDQEREKLKNILRNIVVNFSSNLVFRIFDKELIDFPEAGGIENIMEGDIRDVIREVDGVICTPSSVLLTSMMYDKPTAQIIYRDCPIFLQTGWLIYDVDQVTKTINSMLEGDVDRMRYQSYVVKTNYIQTEFQDVLSRCSECELDPDQRMYSFLRRNIVRLIESPLNINVELALRSIWRRLPKTIRAFIRTFLIR